MPTANTAHHTSLPPAIKQAAAEWFVELQGDKVSEETRQKWRQWRQEKPEHDEAWQRIEAFSERIDILQPALARAALTRTGSPGRRRAVKNLAILLFASSGVLAAQSMLPWQRWTADQLTRAGERKTLVLDDGTSLSLNSDSAVNLRFTASERRIRLLEGEIMVSTAKDSRGPLGASRPFIVETGQGDLLALGTQFTVRTFDDGNSRVAVYEGAVEVRPRLGSAVVVRPGQALDFSSHGAASFDVAAENDTAWVQGMMVAQDMPLSDFAAELSRHRAGWLSCDPDAATLKVTGTYPLDNTDKVLAALTRALPIEIAYLSRYWVRIRRRSDDARG